MSRQANTHGGGSLTNAHGLHFEQTTSLDESLKNSGYIVKPDGETINKQGVILGYSRSKHDFIHFLKMNNVNLSVNSDTLLPDDAFFNKLYKTLYIVEKKFQNVAGSVDEKLQTCLYKKLQYEKLAVQIGYSVAYTYVLNDWFRQEKYRDVREFIERVGCFYFFNELPLSFLRI